MNSKLVNMVIKSTETIRLIRHGEKEGRGYGGGVRGPEVAGEADSIPIATLSPPEGFLH